MMAAASDMHKFTPELPILNVDFSVLKDFSLRKLSALHWYFHHQGAENTKYDLMLFL